MFMFTILGFQLFCNDINDKLNEKISNIITSFEGITNKIEQIVDQEKTLRAMTTLINLGSYLDKSCHTRENFREKINLLLLKIN